MKTLVIGFGVSGKAAAELLLKKKKQVLAIDKNADELKKGLAFASLLGCELSADGQKINWKSIEQVVVSPGISPAHPLVMQAKKQRKEVIGEIEMAVRHLPNCCIGVTGTNGKTTTALLIEHILTKTGRRARALGNIGDPLSLYALAPDPNEILVIELSSFQLETLQTKCLDAALLLNVTPDHLDRYASIEDYGKAKCRIAECLKSQGKLWVSTQVAKDFKAYLPGAALFDKEIFSVAPIPSISYIQWGKPEVQNVQAAFAVCQQFGVQEAEFQRVLESFSKPPHRIEYVDAWEGISFYNDSKATNIDSVLHAMGLFEGSVVLLAGGVDKGASYLPWKQFYHKVKHIVAFGAAAFKIEAELADSFSVERLDLLEEAMVAAMRVARSGDTVLLSPGCSSYDQFRNYEHRGNEFKRLVKEKVWIEEKRS